ncbi:hypothetical protein CFI10_17935 [Marinobacterium iners]|nr:hypothetical protein CFI10_17935 [Marinobacterium iners]
MDVLLESFLNKQYQKLCHINKNNLISMAYKQNQAEIISVRGLAEGNTAKSVAEYLTYCDVKNLFI